MLKNVYNSGIILTSVWKYSGYITNNKNKEQNIELLELKHMGVIHAKLERKKKAAAARLGQAGPKSLGHKPKYSWQISMLPALSMQIQWELSTKAQTTKHQPNYIMSPSSPRFDVCVSHHLCLQIKT